jgi:FG-GAP-like repeat/Immunoglobulin domain/IPT/TIG domain/Immunoglobulin I-set domain
MKKICSSSFKGPVLFTSLASFVALLVACEANASGVPVITGFNPVSATPGNSVVIEGTNFSAVAGDNIVYFGAVRANVASASETNLTVTVPVGATYAPITVTVNGLTAYGNQSFLPTFVGNGSAIGPSTFAPRLDTAGGYGPVLTVITDLDGDGKPDLAVANFYANTVSLFRSVATNGSLSSASFESRVDFPSIGGGLDNPYGLIAADVDGDGKLDLVVSDRSNSRVGIYRNVAVSGTLDTNSFAGPVYFDVGSDPRYLRAGDLDGDGRTDIVTANYGASTISILRNIGVAGSLTTNSFAARVDLPAGAGAYDIAIGDMDGDGKPDIAVVNNGATVLSVFRNIATAGNLDTNSFAPKLDLPAPINSDTIILRDLDGDGKADIIAGSFGNDSIYVYRNIANPGTLSSNSFQQKVEFPTGNGTHNLALGDLNGDGKSDIAVVGESSSYLSVFQNMSMPGSFTSSSLGGRVDYATGWNAWGVSVGDLDGDSRPDVVFCNAYDDTITIYRNVTPFGGPPTILTQPASQTVASGNDVMFSTTPSGSSSFSYQWWHEVTEIVWATSQTLTLTNVQLGDAGIYYVVVTNLQGSVTSSNAVLTVTNQSPHITVQPQGRNVLAGSNVIFSVSVGGSLPLSYQWQFNSVDIMDATNTSYTLFNTQTTNSGSYSVFVTNVYGSTTSSNAVLTVTNQPPFISAQPQNRFVRLGSNTLFTVSAGGSGLLVYQWKLNDTNIDGATSSSLVLTNVQPVNVGIYSVQVTNAAGSVTSSNALLTLVSSVFFDDFDPNIDSPQWSSFGGTVVATNYGGCVSGPNSLWFGGTGSRFAATRSINTTSGGLIEFYLRIAGTTLSSNWETADAGEGVVLEYSTNGGTNWALVAQYNTPGYPNWTLISTNLPAAARSASTLLRWRQLSNSGSASDHWALDDVNISMGLQPPQIVTQPTNRTVVIGQNTTFSVSVTGTVPISYQWRSNSVDIASGTNATLILANVQLSDAGSYSVRVANVVDSATSSNAVLTVTLPPATVRVVNTTNMAGTSVTVPVVLLANGNENAVSFSLDFSTQHLAFVSITLGSDASDALIFPNTSQAGNGRIGVIVAKPSDTTFVAGTREAVQITFNTPLLLGTQSVTTAIVFTNTPITTKLSDVGAQALPAAFANGAVTLVTSDLEGDATPRPVGDRSLDIFDLVQVGRFVAGLDSPTNASEFQRADCAPRVSSGDGQFKVTDWVQSGRYVAGLDPLTVAGGPDAPVAPGPLIEKRGAGGSREVVVADKKAIQGVTATLPVTLESQGNENGLGFTLVFDSTQFVFAGASKGSAATAATFNVNSNQAAAGKVGLALILPSGSSFAVGSREVFKVNLKPKSSADGDYSLTFADQPVVRSVSDTTATELSAVFTANAISVSPPPSLHISVQDVNAIVSWPVWAEGFNLQACANSSLTAGVWTNVVTTMQTNGENIAVTVPIADQAKYFRLQHP